MLAAQRWESITVVARKSRQVVEGSQYTFRLHGGGQVEQIHILCCSGLVYSYAHAGDELTTSSLLRKQGHDPCIWHVCSNCEFSEQSFERFLPNRDVECPTRIF